MADVYRKVFATYPFPVLDPAYLLQTMSEGFLYFCIRVRGRIVAMSSCETDMENRTVEMTDFATLPGQEGDGFSLLTFWVKWKQEMRRRNVNVAYTIARASSYGMNMVFSRDCSYLTPGPLLTIRTFPAALRV